MFPRVVTCEETQPKDQMATPLASNSTFTTDLVVIVGLNEVHEQTSLAADLAAFNGNIHGER